MHIDIGMYLCIGVSRSARTNAWHCGIGGRYCIQSETCRVRSPRGWSYYAWSIAENMTLLFTWDPKESTFHCCILKTSGVGEYIIENSSSGCSDTDCVNRSLWQSNLDWCIHSYKSSIYLSVSLFTYISMSIFILISIRASVYLLWSTIF